MGRVVGLATDGVDDEYVEKTIDHDLRRRVIIRDLALEQIKESAVGSCVRYDDQSGKGASDEATRLVRTLIRADEKGCSTI